MRRYWKGRAHEPACICLRGLRPQGLSARLWCPACGHAAEPVAVESGELLAWTSIPDGEGGLRLLATVRALPQRPDLIIRLPPELAEACAPASGWRCRRGVRTASMRLGAGRPDPSGRPASRAIVQRFTQQMLLMNKRNWLILKTRGRRPKRAPHSIARSRRSTTARRRCASSRAKASGALSWMGRRSWARRCWVCAGRAVQRVADVSPAGTPVPVWSARRAVRRRVRPGVRRADAPAAGLA